MCQGFDRMINMHILLNLSKSSIGRERERERVRESRT